MRIRLWRTLFAPESPNHISSRNWLPAGRGILADFNLRMTLLFKAAL